MWHNFFPKEIEVDFHHVLNDFHAEEKHCMFVVPMPRRTHNFVGGATLKRGHWQHNAMWIKKLYGIEIKELLKDGLDNN